MTDALTRPAPGTTDKSPRLPAARTRGLPAVAELDDELAVAVTSGQRIVAVSRALRMTVRAVESWRADPGRAGCLCRAVEEIRVAIALVDGVTPPRLRRATVWTGPVDEALLYPVSSVARLLGRTVRVMRGLAEDPATATPPGPLPPPLDATARAQCRTAWEKAFHALVRLRAVQEAATWFPGSPVDPWLLLAAEAPPRFDCPECDTLRHGRGQQRSGTEGAKIIPFPARGRTASRSPDHVC